MDNSLILLEDVLLISLVTRHEQDDSIVSHQGESSKDGVYIAAIRRNGQRSEGELSVMIEPEEADNAPIQTKHINATCKAAQRLYVLNLCRKQ